MKKTNTRSAVDHKTLIAPYLADHPHLEGYAYNEFGAPSLDGTSFWDMGFFLLFIELMGDKANAVKLGEVLSVARLSCQNWINKHKRDSKAQIDWVYGEGNQVRRGRYKVSHWGIYRRECFEPFIPLVQSIIDNWLERKNV